MLPYRDDNPTLATPIATVLLIATNVLVWVIVQGAGAEPLLSRSVCELGLIPGEYLHRVAEGTTLPMGQGMSCVLSHSHWFTPISAMFLHGSWLHLIGNMWFLWLFGNNVEDSMGRGRYIAFYLLCGLAAAATQTLLNADSAVPMVGASGAIGGVMGAYVVLYPRVRVHLLVLPFFFRIVVPAFLMLGYWFVLQLVSGTAALGAGAMGGVAFWAHVGGFLAGVILIWFFRDPALVAQHRALARVV